MLKTSDLVEDGFPNCDLYQGDGNIQWNLSQYFIDDDNDKLNLHQDDGNVDWNRNQGQVGSAYCCNWWNLFPEDVTA